MDICIVNAYINFLLHCIISKSSRRRDREFVISLIKQSNETFPSCYRCQFNQYHVSLTDPLIFVIRSKNVNRAFLLLSTRKEKKETLICESIFPVRYLFFFTIWICKWPHQRIAILYINFWMILSSKVNTN